MIQHIEYSCVGYYFSIIKLFRAYKQSQKINKAEPGAFVNHDNHHLKITFYSPLILFLIKHNSLYIDIKSY